MSEAIEIGSVSASLAQAQKEFPAIPRGRTAKVKTKAGYEYSYTYADLGDVVRSVDPILHKNDLVQYQVGEITAGGRQALCTVIAHTKTDEKIVSHFFLPDSNDPQDTGGSITFFRRYALCAALGIVTESDSDGQTKEKKTEQGVAGKKEHTQSTNPSNDLISDAQLKRLFVIQKKSGLPDARLKEMAAGMGITTRSAIPKNKYEALCNLVESWKP